MKALALSQPWAELLVSGRKKVEVRTKNTSFRGWFYVYAARKDTKTEVIERFGFRNLPTGLIVGKAFLKDVKRYQNDTEFYKDVKLHLASRDLIELEGWSLKNKYGYVISESKRITPIPYRGMPGFFNVSLKEN
ncbi:MAG: hypothetical protein A2172_00575 [Candidatus Woykebacteria bacterium RBG_13_40_15]|uniref:ASCH domain-containing protein n=1 Tax=Candidatus Woykebacteria bacterium RBG_13_40_15 TaxID=1802593 RepID=A0A1G1W9Q0_9BACT|nr:MAG: hypothetical protein A2172_00575 [Candidatus Woykebacteria bacterium RBG_13_40_15]